MKTGRNDPCPCGSGKKYKKCCLKSGPDPASYLKHKLDRFHDRIVDEILKHAVKVFSPESLDVAITEFFGWPDEEEMEEIDIEDQEVLLHPWFLFKWEIDPDDDEISLPGPREQSIVQSYLQSHGRRLDPVEREYLEALANAPFSFFEITAVEPGKSVSLRDLLLDRDYRVLEISASQALHEGDVIYGSVIEVGDICLFGALGPIPFSPSAKIEIQYAREAMSQVAKGGITVDTLEEYDIELRDLYLNLYQARTSMPALCNTEGETLSFHTLKYSISSPRKIFNALKGLTNGFASEEDLLNQAEFDENGDLSKVEIPWILPAQAKAGGLENVAHGRLIINGSDMTCEVNSAERAERLRDIIEESLPAGDVVYKTTVIQAAESMLRDAPSSLPPEEDEELMNHPEVKAKIDEMMRKHWDTWPDIELPVLQGKTPRQAVQDEQGRRRVNAILEDAEQKCRLSEGKMGSLENLLRVRRELGLDPESGD